MFDRIWPFRKKDIVSDEEKKRVAAKQKWKCAACKTRLGNKFHVECVQTGKPFQQGTFSTMRALCPDCHTDASAKPSKWQKPATAASDASERRDRSWGLGAGMSPKKRMQRGIFSRIMRKHAPRNTGRKGGFGR